MDGLVVRLFIDEVVVATDVIGVDSVDVLSEQHLALFVEATHAGKRARVEVTDPDHLLEGVFVIANYPTSATARRFDG